MEIVHGGDVYRNSVTMDFSVNINPLGIPEAVKKALQEAVEGCCRYPDIRAEELTKAVGGMLAVLPEYLLFGNGASELFLAIVRALNPKKTVIPIPSFYGYEYAVKAGTGELIYYETKGHPSFLAEKNFLEILAEDVGLVFLANPNNPDGKLLNREELRAFLKYCERKSIYVVLDECFIEFCGEKFSMLREVEQFEHLLLVRAFTKIFAIPGVRLGYLVYKNQKIKNKIKNQLPEWNVSCFAQAAGCACATQTAFVKQTAELIKTEREYLVQGLQKKGISVLPGEANFVLVYSETELYEGLLKRGILIRDCANYPGLGKGYYRIAVRTRAENEVLLEMIGELS